MSTPLPRREFTGTHMLVVMLCFFATIVVANLAMAIAAGRSWTGFVVKNSYVASQQFNEKVAESRAQAALGWTSRLNYHDGKVTYELRDRSGFPVPTESVSVTFRRPASGGEDQTIILSRGEVDGSFAASADIHDGVWIVEVHADTNAGRPYHFVRRVMVRNGALQ